MSVKLPVIFLVCSLSLPGCGKSAPEETGEPESRTSEPSLPVAAIGTEKTPTAEPRDDWDGTGGMVTDLSPPEWTLKEITRLRAMPISVDPNQGGQRRKRNLKIIDLATKVIAETHETPQQKQYFDEAVKQLLEARLENALLGQPDDIDALYADVRNLDERDHDSQSAQEGAFTLARFARTNAQRFAARDPQWLEEFSRQARLFADAYPKAADRAAPLLFSAARSCELHGSKVTKPDLRSKLANEALLCFTQLRDQFPETYQGMKAVSVLRRLQLPGRTLTQFAGPSLDGKFVTIEKLRGRTTVIVFWYSENTEFEEHAEELARTIAEYQRKGVYLLGVNIDEEESGVREFLKRHPLPGKQIFFPKAEERHWDNPLVRYWGILNVPTVWIVDKNGVVVSTDSKLADLKTTLAKVLGE